MLLGMGSDLMDASEVSGELAEQEASGEADLAVPAPRQPLSTRDRLIDAAVVLTSDGGWAAVTMAKLAEHAGVSRQTVYNEIGTKAELAEAMILRELERFLNCVTQAFEQHADDLLTAIRAASYDVLERAQDNRLLHAIVSATHGADTELLPLLTSHSHGLLGFTRELIRENVETFDHGLQPAELDIAIDIVVRVVLSHVMQPLASPEETADGITWMLERVLRAGPGS
jgi:AcrR family transcriptional regulator